MKHSPIGPSRVPRGTTPLSPHPPPPRLEAAVLEILSQGLREIAHPAASDPDRLGQLARLSMLVADWSGRMNLTGHRGPEAIARRLVLDAAAVERVLPEAKTIADLGSGAGFPGLPLAILRPSSQVTLVEARLRRHHFQREAVRALGLAGRVRPLRGRAESVPPVPHDLVLAQAMAQPERALEWMLPWARPGGWLALPGSERPPVVSPPAGVVEAELRRYRAPLAGPGRTLWLGLRED